MTATFLGRLIQWAGAHLTPQTILQGVRSAPQINGWTIAQPYPGWKCCDPYAYGLYIGSGFSGKWDAREVYWSSSAVSPVDNQPGAWVCADPNCRRYSVGTWPNGEPKQPS
jgi:hypothetical protein